MEFIETPVFTKQILRLLTDDDYREFQNELCQNPEAGKRIKGGGGIRKIRWSLPNRGKSSGIRVIYFYKNAKKQVFLLFAYPKNVADNLTDEQVGQLSKLVKEL